MAEIRYLQEKQREIEETDYVNLEDLRSIPSLIGIASGRKRLSLGKIAEVEKARLQRKLKAKGRHAAEGTIKSMLTRIVGQKYGPKVYDKLYDINAYRLIDGSTQKYLLGETALEEFVPVHGKLTFDGKDVIGYQNGKTAYFKADPEKALGSHYKHALEKSGMDKERFKKAFQEYVKLHENNEAAYQSAVLLERLPEDEHGKLEAYTLKSLKRRSQNPLVNDIYTVAVLIDSARQDEFAKGIQKYLSEDIKVDAQALNAGYRYAEAA